MKLLLINNEFPPIGGGGSTVTKYAIDYLIKAGHDVTLITSRFRDLPKKEVINGATIIRIPTIRRYRDFCSMWELVIFGISALIYTFIYTSRNKIDFIQAYFAVPAGWVAWIIYKVKGIPYGVYFGGSDIPKANPSRYQKIYPLITPLLRTIWRNAKFRTVCSQELVRLGKEADSTVDFKLIPNGVETDRFKPIDRPENTKVKILFIGRLIPRKGFQRVLQALPRLRELANVPFEVEVVGTGAYRTELDDIAEKLGVTELVRYVGIVPYDKLEQSYQYADIFVLTSLSEGMPSVILEAMGCALPVVASDVGGNNEIVKHGVNGYLVKNDDTVEILAQYLAELVNNQALRKKMGQESRTIAHQYDWKNIMKEYDTLYTEYGTSKS